MVNAINDKKLFNSMEIDRKMKYQSLRFPKSSSQRRTVSSWFQASNYFALRQTNISHRFEERFHCKKQIFFSKQKPCISPWGWLTFSRPLESTYSQWRPFSKFFLISDSLGPSGVRDDNRSDMDLKLIKINKQSQWWLWVRFSNNYHLIN